MSTFAHNALIYHGPAPPDKDKERIEDEAAYEADGDNHHDAPPHNHTAPALHYDMDDFEQQMYEYMGTRFDAI